MKSVKETDNENKFDKSLQLIEEGSSGINDSSLSMDLEDVQTKMERIIRGKADGETPIHLSGGE